MKAQLYVLLALVIIGNCFIIEEQQIKGNTEILESKIPEYIGLGYHALQGNPFTNRIDEGFRAPIFVMSYAKQQKTEDEAYLIPDYTHSTQSVSCSLESKVSSYTGTENYQKELQKITKIDSRLSFFFIQASFSFSKTFKQFLNSTQSQSDVMPI